MKNSPTIARLVRRTEQWRHAGPENAPPKEAPVLRPRALTSADLIGDGRRRPKVIVVGSGYAGLGVLQYLEARLPAHAADLALVSPVDHLLYTSLLPQVAAGDIEPRHLAVSVRGTLRRTVSHLGHVTEIDPAARNVTVLSRAGVPFTLAWDRLVLAPGAHTRTFDIPGLAEHGLGMKNLAEAVFLRDHVLRQMAYADAAVHEAERRAHCTFVVVGAGYTGTELAAQMRRFTMKALAQFPRLRSDQVRWLLLDLAPKVLPELDEHLGIGASRVLRERGVEVRLKTSVQQVRPDSVTLTSGEVIATHTLVWCAGVTPNPLVSSFGAETVRGRLVVDERFRVPGHAGMFALGDAAAVPDSTRGGVPAGQTAQNAVRQGTAAGRNIAASLGYGAMHPYQHRDLGFVVDLGGADAVANPVGLRLSGLPAAVVTRAYHLLALKAGTNRAYVAADWLLGALMKPRTVQLGFLPPPHATIAQVEQTELYQA
ncbi:NAD(P)/FAD-dependent oxidoreductase [Parafrankia sp. EUN1f]|uniref:NAD(P)/FAD-dependent oxidoreductase n=1 Tax=Parafrankia sp. EUN1f TaxID=102897 RepID=UPI0001C46388|nr:NAD(P)/FAD-dependent oxidoreductase [Parafrankia sp. EUN1f]EFC81400.1 FAD-dependent pyridine nucleotide-disulphide oxidoreductase [Parafrankia sp. EUN1f]